MRKIVLAAVLAALSAVPLVAQEGPICMKRSEIIEQIGGRYKEQRRVSALTMQGTAIIEFWANETTGSWTMFATQPDGMSCLVSSGLGFEVADATPEGELS